MNYPLSKEVFSAWIWIIPSRNIFDIITGGRDPEKVLEKLLEKSKEKSLELSLSFWRNPWKYSFTNLMKNSWKNPWQNIMKNCWNNPERNLVRRIPGRDLKITLTRVIIWISWGILGKIPEHSAKKIMKAIINKFLQKILWRILPYSLEGNPERNHERVPGRNIGIISKEQYPWRHFGMNPLKILWNGR